MRTRAARIALSIALATLTWAIVHNMERSPAYFTVPITFQNPPEVIRLDGATTEARIRVLATKAKRRMLSASAFDIRVPYDGEVGRQFIVLDPQDVDAPFGVKVEQVEPSSFVVVYDRRASRTLPVDLQLLGEPAPGYELVRDEIEVIPAAVTLSGPASLLQSETAVRTERVDIEGRRITHGPRRLALQLPGSDFALEGVAQVQATIPIRPRTVQRSFEDVRVQVLRGRWETSPPNPRSIRVVVEGPEPALMALSPDAVTATLDVRDLPPRGEDYRPEPRVLVDPAACPDCRVVGVSQSRINVNVKSRPSSAVEESGFGRLPARDPQRVQLAGLRR